MTGARTDAVLFDLDGTLLDTAPDLLAAVNDVRARRSLPPLPLSGFREQVSRGARAMLTIGLPGFAEIDADAKALAVSELLAAYEAEVCRHTDYFPGMADAVATLAARGIRLGIVTNKPIRMAQSVLDHLGLRARFPALLGGDSLPQRKPHPLPVLTACEQLGVQPGRTLFVGDDARDVEAGRAAGCRTVIAAWGYLDRGEIAGWGADAIIEHPRELLDLVA